MKPTASSLRLWYGVLVVLSLAETLLILAENGGPYYLPDSPSYIRSAAYVRELEPGLLRTPVLPFVIGVLKRLTGDVWPWLLVAVQTCAFLFSAVLLRRTARKYIGSEIICFVITAYYLLAPGILYWNTAELTESFSLSGAVTLIYIMLRPLPGTPSSRNVIAASAMLLVLVFLRPVFIYLLPIFALYYIIVFARHRGHVPMRPVLCAAAGFALTVASLIAYTMAFHHRWGFHSMCCIPSINNYHMIRQSGLLCPELADDAQLRGMLESFPDTIGHGFGYKRNLVWKEVNEIFTIKHTAAIEAYVNRVIDEHPGPIMATIVDRFTDQSPRQSFLPLLDTFEPRPSITYSDVSPSLFFSFGNYWLLMAILAVIWLRQWRRTRQIPLATGLLGAVSVGLVVTTLVGAMSDWQRLTLPALPAFLLLAGKFCTLFSRNDNTL